MFFSSSQVTALAFANFSQALKAVRRPGGGEVEVRKVTVDYNATELSRSEDARKALGARLGAVAGLLEEELGCAQDVEGCLVGQQLFVVQSRPQP